MQTVTFKIHINLVKGAIFFNPATNIAIIHCTHKNTYYIDYYLLITDICDNFPLLSNHLWLMPIIPLNSYVLESSAAIQIIFSQLSLNVIF